MSDEQSFDDLIRLSCELGKPENDYIILAEGNTSVRIDADSFWVKASGYSLRNIAANGFVQMRFQPVLDLLDGPDLPETDLKAALDAAKVDLSAKARPSIEVALHAILLTQGQAQVIGHTHPVAWNSILCSVNAEQAVSGRIFPDQVVVCGPMPLFIKYTDPGLPLAREVRQRLAQFIDTYGEPPKEILMENHGLIVLGQSTIEVERIMAMSVKAARILVGAHACGKPKFLSEADIWHLWRRPDEIARRTLLTKTQANS